MKYYSGLERRAFERGRQLGFQIGLHAHLKRFLGDLKPTTIKRIAALPTTQLELLADALVDFSTMSDLNKWLRENGKSVTLAKTTKVKK